jgi:transcriptional regulator with XRE-family HTH domain
VPRRRYSAANDLPKEPGDWLRLYRERPRPHHPNGCTREELGAHLGVASKTIERWESGRSRPEARDLVALSAYLELTDQERAFVNRAFIPAKTSIYPSPDHFELEGRRLLSSRFPGILLDGLLYVRGFNGYLDALHPTWVEMLGEGEYHILELVLAGRGDGRWMVDWDSYVHRWVRYFWSITARFCGLPEYRRLISQLAAVEGFRDLWLDLGKRENGTRPFGTPTEFTFPRTGNWRVYDCNVDFPPQYHLREYVPIDGQAIACLDERWRQGPASVSLPRPFHWAED